MDKRDKVREQIRDIGCRNCEARGSCLDDGFIGDCEWLREVDQILAISELAVVDREASLPEIPLFLYDCTVLYGGRELLRRGAINYSKMLAGWVKEAK